MSLLSTILPVFIIIMLGYGLKQQAWVRPDFWRALEKLVYLVLLPAVLFFSISTSKFNIEFAVPMAMAAVTALLLVVLFLFALRRYWRIPAAEFSSVFQGAVQSNVAYVGLPCAWVIYGKEGVALYALLIAFLVPFVNIGVMLVLAMLSTERKPSVLRLCRQVFGAPHVVACVVGILWSVLPLSMPLVFRHTLEMLSNASAAMGLLVVGGALRVSDLRGQERWVALSSVLKLAVLPALTLITCVFFGVRGLAAQITVLYAVLPTAAATSVLAARFGGNIPLAAIIVTVETILAMVMIPLFVQLAQFLFS